MCVCVCSMCVSVTSKKCGTAVSSPAYDPSPTLGVRPSSPSSAHCRKFTQRSVHFPLLQLLCDCLKLCPGLQSVAEELFQHLNIKLCSIRWLKLACSAAGRPDWPKTWRKLVSRWTRGIRPISSITTRTSNLFSTLDCTCLLNNEPLGEEFRSS